MALPPSLMGIQSLLQDFLKSSGLLLLAFVFCSVNFFLALTFCTLWLLLLLGLYQSKCGSDRGELLGQVLSKEGVIAA